MASSTTSPSFTSHGVLRVASIASERPRLRKLPQMVNVFQSLHRRRSNPRNRRQTKKTLAWWAESVSVARFKCNYCELSQRTKSTISICFCPDGSKFASTHGDHTVKVIAHPSGRVLQVMHGHPRTPWTVKFHPTDTDIVASGCLDFEVRVWSASTGDCLYRTKVDRHVVSIAFHPGGRVLGIATVNSLYLWTYQSPRGPVKIFNASSALRCVDFPRSGRYLITGETNARPHHGGQPGDHTVCLSLWKFDCEAFLARTSGGDDEDDEDDTAVPSTAPRYLSDKRVVVRKALLYNDGGFEVSPDERYLVACVHGTNMSPEEELELMQNGSSSAQNSTQGGAGATAHNTPTSAGGRRGAQQAHPGGNVTAAAMARGVAVLEGTPQPPKAPGRRRAAKAPPRVGSSNSVSTHLSRASAFAAAQRWAGRYRLALVSLVGDNLGRVILSSPIPRGHAKEITSVKLSPSCAYILLGYQRRPTQAAHGGLEALRSDQQQRRVATVYRTCDMRLISTVHRPSDDINIALFHPVIGHGFVYGTKQGKVCLVQPDRNQRSGGGGGGGGGGSSGSLLGNGVTPVERRGAGARHLAALNSNLGF